MARPRSPWSPGSPLQSRILGFHRDHREATRRSRSKRPRPPVVRRSGTITLRASSAPGPRARTKEPSTWARLPAQLKACGRHAGRPPSWPTSRTGRRGNHSPSTRRAGYRAGSGGGAEPARLVRRRTDDRPMPLQRANGKPINPQGPSAQAPQRRPGPCLVPRPFFPASGSTPPEAGDNRDRPIHRRSEGVGGLASDAACERFQRRAQRIFSVERKLTPRHPKRSPPLDPGAEHRFRCQEASMLPGLRVNLGHSLPIGRVSRGRRSHRRSQRRSSACRRAP